MSSSTTPGPRHWWLPHRLDVEVISKGGAGGPGLFAQEGRRWRMIYENPVGQGTHCPEPVALE